jgi:hypothetical protein
LRPAMTPPVHVPDGPVTQLVAGDSSNAIVAATSSAVPTRSSGWKASKLCRGRLELVLRDEALVDGDEHDRRRPR